MALEAQEVAVRVRLIGGSAFQREAAGVSGSIKGMGAAGAEANAAHGGLLGTLNKAGTVMSSTGSKFMKFGGQARQVGTAMTAAAVPILFLGAASAKSALDFSRNMTLLQTQALASGKQVNWLKKQVLGLPAVFGTPVALSEGLYNIVSSGLRGADAMNALKAAAMGASMGIDTINNTSSGLMAIMNTGLKDVPKGNFQGAMSIIDAIVGTGMMRLPQLLDALHSEILPMAKESGLGLKDIGAVMAVMTRQGIPAQRFANLMKLTLTKMIAPNGEGLKALQFIGLGKYTLAHLLKSGNGLQALSVLQQHLSTVSPDQQRSVLAAAFGQSRGITNILAILNKIPDVMKVRGLIGRKATPQGFEQRFGAFKQSPAGKWQILVNTLQKDLTKIGLVLLPILTPLLKQVTGLLQTITGIFLKLPTPLRDFLVKAMALGVVLGPMVWIVGSLATAFGGILKVGGFLTSAITGKTIPALLGLGTEAGVVGGASGLGALALGITRVLGPLALFAAFFFGVKSRLSSQQTNTAKHVGGVPGVVAAFGPAAGPGGLPSPGGGPLGGLGLGHYDNSHQSPSTTYMVINGRLVKVPGMAVGGNVSRGGTFWVGEAGPELLSLPTGSRVTPLSYLRQFGGDMAAMSPGAASPLPHLTGGSGMFASRDSVKGALAGSLELTSNVYLDGQLVAKTVNKVNRQNANRK